MEGGKEEDVDKERALPFLIFFHFQLSSLVLH